MNHLFANCMVAIMTLFMITNYHRCTCIYAEWFVSYSLLDCRVHTGFANWVIRILNFDYGHGMCDQSAEDAYSS
jgi:hypothetical protein